MFLNINILSPYKWGVSDTICLESLCFKIRLKTVPKIEKHLSSIPVFVELNCAVPYLSFHVCSISRPMPVSPSPEAVRQISSHLPQVILEGKPCSSAKMSINPCVGVSVNFRTYLAP